MTLNEIAEQVAFFKGDPFNQMLLQNIKFSVRHWRAVIIRRDIATNGLSEEYLQRIYLDLQKVDKADSCSFDLGACDTILRTTLPIPQPIRIKSDTPFKFAGTVDGKPFIYTEFEEVPYTCYKRFTSKEMRYNYTNGYIYIFNNKMLKKMSLVTAFVDPYKANVLCTGCFDDSSEFPCPADMVNSIIKGLVDGEYRIFKPGDDGVQIDSEDERL